MNWDQFKGILCYLCFYDCVITLWSLKHEVVGSSNPFKLFFFTEFSKIKEKSIIPAVKEFVNVLNQKEKATQ